MEAAALEVKKTKVEEEKTEKMPSMLPPAKKNYKKPQERKSQSKMKDMMKGMTEDVGAIWPWAAVFHEQCQPLCLS
jgi:hypothetical protein